MGGWLGRVVSHRRLRARGTRPRARLFVAISHPHLWPRPHPGDIRRLQGTALSLDLRTGAVTASPPSSLPARTTRTPAHLLAPHSCAAHPPCDPRVVRCRARRKSRGFRDVRRGSHLDGPPP